MQSGAYYGYLGAIEKMVQNLKDSIGSNAKVVATGGFARLFADEELFDYIDQNLGSDLTLSTLAGKCFYNPSYFSRAFKKETGLSPMDFLKSIK